VIDAVINAARRGVGAGTRTDAQKGWIGCARGTIASMTSA
jgi:hypothetical protein